MMFGSSPYNSYGIQDDQNRVNYTLGLLHGAAASWRQDYIATHGGQNAQTWVQFSQALEQAFAPAQQAHEAEQQLRHLKQRGRYIEEYISEFAVLASQAGLTADSVAVQAYFAAGLDRDVRHEALRSDPQTLDRWKTAARNAFRIVAEQQRYRQGNSSQRPPKNRQRKGKGNRSNPRYNNIHNQPVLPQYRRSEWDMDINFFNSSYNEINSYDSEEEEEYNKLEEESEDDKEISYSQHKGRDKENVALSHIINNVLTDEQQATLKRGECFFCHKQGHFYRDCAARKIYINNRGKKPMAPKHNKQSKP